MKIYVKWWQKTLATCALAFVFLWGFGIRGQANAHSPDRLAGAVSIRQQGEMVTIHYPASQIQRQYTIYHAVWSDENGQDDIVWHRAGPQTTNLSLNQHQGQGLYHAHTYINIKGRMVGLNATTFQVSRPLALTSSVRVSEVGTIELHVNQVPTHFRELLIPTWSDVRGQDDLRWYRVNRQWDGSFSLRVSLADHQSDLGIYHFNIYGINSQTGRQEAIAGQSFEVTDQHLPKTKVATPQFSISQINSPAGSYQVNAQDSGKAVQSMSLAVWSADQQSNIKWYHLSPTTDGVYTAQVSLANHQYLAGLYQNHLYITYRDGSQVGHVLELVDFSSYRQSLKSSIPTSSSYQSVSRETNTYPIGECTWGVKELAPWVGNYWGNARDWYPMALSLGFEVGYQPKVGAVAVWPEDGYIGGQTYGHVAVVTEVDSPNRIQVKEANYAGHRYVANFRGWFDPHKIWRDGRYIDSLVYYIYPKV